MSYIEMLENPDPGDLYELAMLIHREGPDALPDPCDGTEESDACWAIIEGGYWYATDHHNGMSSELYVVVSQFGRPDVFWPGGSNGPGDSESEMYYIALSVGDGEAVEVCEDCRNYYANGELPLEHRPDGSSYHWSDSDCGPVEKAILAGERRFGTRVRMTPDVEQRDLHPDATCDLCGRQHSDRCYIWTIGDES